MFARLTAYLRTFARRRQVDAEADDEMRFHLEHEIEANITRGMSPIEANRVALRDLAHRRAGKPFGAVLGAESQEQGIGFGSHGILLVDIQSISLRFLLESHGRQRRQRAFDRETKHGTIESEVCYWHFRPMPSSNPLFFIEVNRAPRPGTFKPTSSCQADEAASRRGGA